MCYWICDNESDFQIKTCFYVFKGDQAMRVRCDLSWGLVVITDDPLQVLPDDTIVWQSTDPTTEEWRFHDEIRPNCVTWYRAIKDQDDTLTPAEFGREYLQPLLSTVCPDIRVTIKNGQWAFCIPGSTDVIFTKINQAVNREIEDIRSSESS